MGYGLEFYGDNNQLIFDTDNFDGGQTLTVVGSGSILHNDTYGIPSSSLVFGRVADGYEMLGNTNSSGVLTNKSGTTISYVVAKFTSAGVDDITGAGNYGLEVFDSSGNITFSTKKTNSTTNFQRIFDKGELTTNGATVYSAASTANVYVSINYMYWGDINNYANGFSFTSTTIGYKGRLFSTAPEFPYDFTVPNIGTIGVIKLRG